MSDFDAYRIFDEDGKIEGRLVTVTLDDLSRGDVVIETAYSSVNYKDALAATGAGKIVRRFPLTGGIDPKPFVWTASVRQILKKVNKANKTLATLH